MGHNVNLIAASKTCGCCDDHQRQGLWFPDKIYCGKKTIPLGAARNKALEQCFGDYVAFLDCDDYWMEGRLKKQMELMLRKKI